MKHLTDKQFELMDRMVKEEEEFLTFARIRNIRTRTIVHFITTTPLTADQLEKLNGSLICVGTAKNIDEIKFYYNHFVAFSKLITEALNKKSE